MTALPAVWTDLREYGIGAKQAAKGFEMLSHLAISCGWALLLLAASTAGTILVSQIVGARIYTIGLFMGPTVMRFRIGHTRLHVGSLPLGNYVRYAPSEDDFLEGVDPEALAESIRTAEEDFGRLHPLSRASICLGGWVVLVLLAFALIGPQAAITEVGSGFVQLLQGTISPLGKAQELFMGFFSAYESRSIGIVVGIIATKIVAFNMLPLPPLAGGEAIRILVGWVQGARSKDGDGNRLPMQWVTWPSFLCICLMFLSWVAAIVVFAINAA